MIKIINTTKENFDFLKPEIEKRFGQECILEHSDLGITFKGQILAIDILKKFGSQKEKTLIITDKDLGAVGLNFVFGQADLMKSIAVLSTARLKGLKFRERVVKETVHELGHLFFLEHCEKPCVMSFSNSILDVDEKSSEFCDKCKQQIFK